MFYTKGIGMIKYFVSFSMIATLAACSDDGIVGPVFNPDVPPQNVQVVSGDSNTTDVQNTISWTKDSTATDYVVYVSNTPGVTDSSSQVVPAASGSNYVTHSGTDVVAGTPLYYKVQALSGTQSSVLSSEVTGTPQISIATHNLKDVAWNGTDTLVAVGDEGEIITSPNGLQDGWTSTAVAGLAEALSAVTWESTNNQFLVVGAGLTVLTWDGSNNPWQPRDLTGLPLSNGSATDLEDVAWVDDRYVAVGKNSVIITSVDGISWTVQYDGGPTDTTTLTGVAANSDGSKTVAVGTNGTLLTSDDKGLNWTPWTVTESNTLNDVTWDGSQFIVVGTTGTIYTSTNGADWEYFDLISVDSAFIGVTQWDSSSPPVDPIPAIVGATGDFIVFPDATTGLFIRTGTTELLSANTWVDDGVNPAYFVIVGHDGFVLTSQLQ